MYFFRIKISSFDDEEKTLFVVPEQNADEKGIPFDEKLLTQTAEYKQFVKDTATNMVDGEYTQFQTDAVFDTINEQQFTQLEAEGKLTTVDSNTFSVSTGIKPAKKGGGTLDFKTIAIIAAIAVAGIVLLIFSFARGGTSGETSTDISESSETVESSTSETSTTEPETSETSSTESSFVTESSSESSGFVDEPPESTVSEPIETEKTTDNSGYTNGGYSSGSSDGASGVYTISFNPNGGEGAIGVISAEAGQYVTLPSAETAAKSIVNGKRRSTSRSRLTNRI